MKKKLFLISIFILLTGCGYHLRGIVKDGVPPWLNNVTIIVKNANADLKTRLSEQLRAYYVRVCPTPDQAKYFLIVENEEYKSNIASVSSNTTSRQFQVIYTLWFKVQDSTGKEIIPINQLQVARLATINDERILGSAQEELHTKSEMRQDAVLQIINRLNR